MIWGFDPKRARGATYRLKFIILKWDWIAVANDVRIDQRDDRLDMVLSKDSEKNIHCIAN